MSAKKTVTLVHCADVLCIFCPTGATFTFRSVQIIQNNETHLQFRYSAMSDGRMKEATFIKANIVGWSVNR